MTNPRALRGRSSLLVLPRTRLATERRILRRQSIRMSNRNAKESLGRVFGIGFISIGSLIAIAGLVWLIRTASFVSTAAKAPGQVTAMERSQGSHGFSTFHPVFTFTDGSGIIHTQRSSFGYSFEVGERVTVLYDAAIPKHSKIESFQTVWLGPLICSGLGMLLGCFASFWLSLWSGAARIEGKKGPYP